MLFHEMIAGDFTQSDAITAQVAQAIRVNAERNHTPILHEISAYLKTLRGWSR